MSDKERLISAFNQLLFDHSFDEISCDSIADKANLTLKEYNKYFNNNKEILYEIFGDMLDKKLQFIQDLNRQDISLQNKLINFLNYHFEKIENNFPTTKLLVKETMIPENSCREVKLFAKKAPILFEKMISIGLKNNEIRDVEPKIIANAILHAIHGVTIKVMYDSEFQPPQAKKELINLLYIGIKK